jgi:hypothetical protein
MSCIELACKEEVLNKCLLEGWAQWCMSAIPALERRRQEDG